MRILLVSAPPIPSAADQNCCELRRPCGGCGAGAGCPALRLLDSAARALALPFTLGVVSRGEMTRTSGGGRSPTTLCRLDEGPEHRGFWCLRGVPSQVPCPGHPSRLRLPPASSCLCVPSSPVFLLVCLPPQNVPSAWVGTWVSLNHSCVCSTQPRTSGRVTGTELRAPHPLVSSA